MKKILILFPQEIKQGQPPYERINSFKIFFQNSNLQIYSYMYPKTIKSKINLIRVIYQNSIKNIFISMPPFGHWYLFLLPATNIILDIRDGWSIAIKSGYGGLKKKQKVKGFISAIIEKIIIRRSVVTITCTLGLKKYLDRISKNKIIMITNGYSFESYKIVNELLNNSKGSKVNDNEKEYDIAVCVGQFSEYGKDKVKTIMQKIRDQNKITIFKLIGSNKDKNEWIQEWLKENQITNIILKILPWMNKTEMYKEIINSTYGVTVIRDPDYDYGTKVFDYILCNIPILNYYLNENAFTEYFKEYFKTNGSNKRNEYSFLREDLIEEKKNILLNCLL